MNPLDQLRDIHLPGSVQWWPLAIGWWLLGALLLALILFFVWRLNRNKQKRRMVNLSMQSLEALEADAELNDQEWLQSLSALLRRIVINLHGRKAAAGLVGSQWLEYLDRSNNDNDFSVGLGQVLATQPYQETASYDRKALSGLVRKWIKSQGKMSKQQSESSVLPTVKAGVNHA